MPKKKEKSRDELVDAFKRKLRKQGKTLKKWGKENGYTETQVYNATRGLTKGLSGKAKEIAQHIGLF